MTKEKNAHILLDRNWHTLCVTPVLCVTTNCICPLVFLGGLCVSIQRCMRLFRGVFEYKCLAMLPRRERNKGSKRITSAKTFSFSSIHYKQTCRDMKTKPPVCWLYAFNFTILIIPCSSQLHFNYSIHIVLSLQKGQGSPCAIPATIDWWFLQLTLVNNGREDHDMT